MILFSKWYINYEFWETLITGGVVYYGPPLPMPYYTFPATSWQRQPKNAFLIWYEEYHQNQNFLSHCKYTQQLKLALYLKSLHIEGQLGEKRDEESRSVSYSRNSSFTIAEGISAIRISIEFAYESRHLKMWQRCKFIFLLGSFVKLRNKLEDRTSNIRQPRLYLPTIIRFLWSQNLGNGNKTWFLKHMSESEGQLQRKVFRWLKDLCYRHIWGYLFIHLYQKKYVNAHYN